MQRRVLLETGSGHLSVPEEKGVILLLTVATAGTYRP